MSDGIFADKITGDVPNYFWNDLLAERSIGAVCGPSGVGKSLIVIKIVADLTRMGKVVIYGNAEDDRIMQKMRLEAAGADMTKVWLESFVLPDQFYSLESRAAELHASVVVFDTAQKHINGPMQRWDRPLAELHALCGKLDMTSILVHHTNKNVKKSADWRAAIGGATAGLVGTSRFLALVGKRTDNGDQVVYCPVKDSYRATPQGLAFEFNTDDLTQSNGDFVEISHMSIAERGVKIGNPTELVVVQGDGNGNKGPDPIKAAEAADFLKEQLADGPRPVNDVYRCNANPNSDKSDPSDPDWKSRACGHMSVTYVEVEGGGSCPDCGSAVAQIEGLKSAAEAAQVSFGTIKRAKAALTIDTECKGFSKKRVQHWSLPDGHPNLNPGAVDYLP